MRTLLFLLAALPAAAQLQRVEMKVSGLDCASCGASVETRLKRVPGVEAAGYDAAASKVDVTLRAENTVTLAAIRDALKSLGYTPGDANVKVRGEIREDAGKWLLTTGNLSIALEGPGLKPGTGLVEGTARTPAAGETEKILVLQISK